MTLTGAASSDPSEVGLGSFLAAARAGSSMWHNTAEMKATMMNTTNEGGTSRGVYAAERASALAGVPRSTVYYWARTDLLRPSVSLEKLKLWSWADLVALRAVYWLRHPSRTEQRRQTKMTAVRDLIQEIEGQVGKLGEAISSKEVLLYADAAGTPHLEFADRMVESAHHWLQQVERDLVIELLSPFSAEPALRGPHLLRPRDELRIVPGKLAGEPHVENTRIETRVLWALSQRGYTPKELTGLYPGLSLTAAENAVDLECQLERNSVAA